MYLLGRLIKSEDSQAMLIELSKGCIGVMPVFETKEDAIALCFDKFTIYEMGEK